MEEKSEYLKIQKLHRANTVQELKTGGGCERSRWKLVYVGPPHSS